MQQINVPGQIQEEILWEGHPSYWLYTKKWALAALLTPLFGAGIVYAVFLRFWIRSCHYRLTNQRLIWTRGILNRKTDQTELYRVRDVSVAEPLSLRVFGIGHVLVMSSDASTPVEELSGVRDPQAVAEALRAAVEAIRMQRGIRALDVETYHTA